jgi:ribosomal protein S18 acetylase RimI-like enzyme
LGRGAIWVNQFFGFLVPEIPIYWGKPARQFHERQPKRCQKWALWDGFRCLGSDWDHFSICRSADLAQINLDHYKEDGQWDAYQIQTKVHGELPPLENLNSPKNHQRINQFLSGHFPDSSVKAGDPEVAAWPAILDQENQIIAIGALSIWESGKLAAQSIAVDKNHRGQGLGKEFVKRLVSTANHLGYENMCLGVWHFNEVAKHVYETSGFHLIDRFIHYARVDDPIKRTNRPVRD